MNAPLPWHDPVVAEIHIVREELVRVYGSDLFAYSDAAVARCERLNLHVAKSGESEMTEAMTQGGQRGQLVKPPNQ